MLCLVRVKACKRCGGDLSLECDIYGVYAECIQCGATWSKKVMTRPIERGIEIITKETKPKVPSHAASKR